MKRAHNLLARTGDGRLRSRRAGGSRECADCRAALRIRAAAGGEHQGDGGRAVPPRRDRSSAMPTLRSSCVKHPEWRRDRVAGLFADEGYLRHWASAASPGAAIAQQPVTQVSWFAASAYCEARGARLPRWYEWEFAAAASATEARRPQGSGVAAGDSRLVFEVGARPAARGRRVAANYLRHP